MVHHSWGYKTLVVMLTLSIMGQLVPLPVAAAQTISQATLACAAQLPFTLVLNNAAVAQLRGVRSGQERTLTSDGVKVTLQNNGGAIAVKAISGFPQIKSVNTVNLIDLKGGALKITVSAPGTASMSTITPSVPAEVFHFQNPPLPNRSLPRDGQMWHSFADNILKEFSMMDKGNIPFDQAFTLHLISSPQDLQLTSGNHMVMILPGSNPLQFSFSGSGNSRGIITNGTSQYMVENLTQQRFIISSVAQQSLAQNINTSDLVSLSRTEVAIFLAALAAEKQLGNSVASNITLLASAAPAFMPYQFTEKQDPLFIQKVYAQGAEGTALEELMKAFADTAEAAQKLEQEAAKDPTKARAIARQLLRLWQNFGKLLRGLKPNDYIAFKKLGDTAPIPPGSAAAPRVVKAIKWVTGPLAVVLLVLDMPGTAHANPVTRQPSACSVKSGVQGNVGEEHKKAIKEAFEKGEESPEMFAVQNALCQNNSCASSCVIKKEERKLFQNRGASSFSYHAAAAYDQKIFSDPIQAGSLWNPLNWNIWGNVFYQDVYYCGCN